VDKSTTGCPPASATAGTAAVRRAGSLGASAQTGPISR